MNVEHVVVFLQKIYLCSCVFYPSHLNPVETCSVYHLDDKNLEIYHQKLNVLYCDGYGVCYATAPKYTLHY
jgi:hypothetical protein